MRSIQRIAAVAIGLAATLCGAAEAGVTYTLAGDFSTGANPNGAWTYGKYASPGAGPLDPGSFSRFQASGPAIASSLPDLNFWNDHGPNANVDPNIIYNPGATFTTNGFGTITFNSKEVTFGPYLGPTVARWIAPAAGVYGIDAAFQTVQVGNTAPNAYVFVNGVGGMVGTSALSATPTSYQSLQRLIQGEIVDFVVAGGSKTTQVDVTITTMTPEPATLLMCGPLAVFVAACLRRRRRANAPS